MLCCWRGSTPRFQGLIIFDISMVIFVVLHFVTCCDLLSCSQFKYDQLSNELSCFL